MRKGCVCLLFGLFLGLIQISCNDENNESGVSYQLKTTAITLKTGKTLQLEVEPATGWTFSSKNSNIASVSDSGLVTTYHVGTTMVYVRHNTGQFLDSVQVTVEPRFSLYGDPCLNFSASEQTVSNTETGTYSNRYMDPKREGAFYLIYSRQLEGNTKQDIYYHFNANGALDLCEVPLHPVHAFETTEHLSERYLFLKRKVYALSLNNEEYKYVDNHYISPDSSTLICMTYESIRFTFKVEFRPFNKQTMEAILNDTIGKVYDR